MMWEYEGQIPGTCVTAYVDKIGGGTRGKKYSGDWLVRLVSEYEGQILHETLSVPHSLSHEQIGKIAMEFIDWDD